MSPRKHDSNRDDAALEDRGARSDTRVISTFTETFGLTRAAAVGMVVFIALTVIVSVFWFIASAPPRRLVITSGPPGSSFQRFAELYRLKLASNGVTLKILPSQGSVENLKRLSDPAFHVDLGFVQAGETNTGSAGEPANSKTAKLFSLGSIAYQPLLIFYHSATPVVLLSDFAGKKLAIGPAGTGTREVALELLATNGIVPEDSSTALLGLDAADAADALAEGKIDAVFLMGDSASTNVMRNLMRKPGIQLYDFVQADAYTRKFTNLNKLEFPRGAIDFGRDIPPHDVNLVGPTVELVARGNLHPALSDLLLDAAREVNGKATTLQRRGEFPAPLEHQLKISPDALRYYSSGKRFLYRSLPFWLATLLNQIFTAIVPMLLILIPGLKMIPTAYKWRIQLRIYRRYRKLLKVEQELNQGATGEKLDELRKQLDAIEDSVNHMRVPASFAGQFYSLREHIGFVRERMGDEPGDAE
jgi:hypothetical protein